MFKMVFHSSCQRFSLRAVCVRARGRQRTPDCRQPNNYTHPYFGTMNVIQEIKRINERELEQGMSGKASWHYEYKDSAWVFAGGFSYDLTEGDILCVMSQWGEIEDINLCREKDTGKSKVLGYY